MRHVLGVRAVGWVMSLLLEWPLVAWHAGRSRHLLIYRNPQTCQASWKRALPDNVGESDVTPGS